MAGIFDYLYGPGGLLEPTSRGMPWEAATQATGSAAPPPPSLGASLSGAQYSDPATTAASVGGNVGALPLPMPRPAEANAPPYTGAPPGAPNYMSMGPGGQTGAGGGGGTGASSTNLRDALRGVTAPKPPEVQAVRTPPPPQVTPIKGGEFLSLLAGLGVGPQELMRLRLGGR